VNLRRFEHRLLAAVPIAALLVMGSAGPARAGLLGIGFDDGKLYDISTSNAATSNPRPVGPKINMITFAPSGVLYGVSQGFPTDVPAGGKLFTINVTTGAPTYVATLNTFVVTEGDIACDPTNGVLYAVDGGGQLFTINTTTGAGTVIGTIPGNVDLSAMAFDGSGNLYIVDQFGPALLKVNKFNAAIISSVNMSSVDTQIGGLAFEPGSGTLYYCGGTPTTKLYTVNPVTGVATLKGSKPAVIDGVSGLAFLPLEVAAGLNKDFYNTTSSVADGVDIILQGVYSSVWGHFDGYPPHQFTNFSVVPAGPNTILRWSGGTTIPVNDKAHVGFFVVGTQYQALGVIWRSGGSSIGFVDQFNMLPHLTANVSPSVTIANTLSQTYHGTMYAGNLSIEYFDQTVPLGLMTAGVSRNPIRTDVSPIPTVAIAQGDSASFPFGAPPAGATHALVIFNVGRTPDMNAPGVTSDWFEVPLTGTAVPGAGPAGSMILGVMLAGASAAILRRRRRASASSRS
jgi:hypothetical protein